MYLHVLKEAINMNTQQYLVQVLMLHHIIIIIERIIIYELKDNLMQDIYSFHWVIAMVNTRSSVRKLWPVHMPIWSM